MKKTAVKSKKCKGCKGKFQPWNTTQQACSPECAIAWNRLKAKKKQEKENRQAVRALKTNTLSYRMRKAQDAFNKYIRLRDERLPCISCGRFENEIDWTPGGIWDCGHFKTRGAFPELRFEELNAHKQCKKCNGGSGKFTKKNHTVSKDYEINLISKIGQEKVDWLNGPHEAKHYSVDDLRVIEKLYKQKTKELIACQNHCQFIA